MKRCVSVEMFVNSLPKGWSFKGRMWKGLRRRRGEVKLAEEGMAQEGA
jgi:hypothetical protein